MPERTQLRGLAWESPRGIGAARASAREYARRTSVDVEWSSRPLWRFAYMSLAEMFAAYDLVMFDHPTVGTVVDGHAPMLDLASFVEDDLLRAIRASSIGPTYASYSVGDRQYGLPIDAAAQVSVLRHDLLPSGLAPPCSWSEVATFATALSELGLETGLPMNYSDATVNLYTIGAQLTGDRFYSPDSGFDVEALAEALAVLDSVVAVANPASLFAAPVSVLEGMTTGSRMAYLPLQFAYAHCARRDFSKHPVSFLAPPTFASDGVGTTMGGVGIAVSAATPHPQAAVDYACFLTTAECQTGPFFQAGGQPSHRAAWSSPDLDAATGHFFSSTRDVHERAVIRPRAADCPWFFDQQVVVGKLMVAALEQGEPLSGLAGEITDIDRRMARDRVATETSGRR